MSGIDGNAGVLEPFADRYRVRLLALGYRPRTIDHKLRDLGELGRWMARGGIQARQLDVSMIESFLLVRRAAGDRPPLTGAELPAAAGASAQRGGHRARTSVGYGDGA